MTITTRAEIVRDNPRGAPLFSVDEGEAVNIRGARDDWVNVEFPQRPPETLKGWLPKDAVGDGAAAVAAIKKQDFARRIAFEQGRVLVQGHYLAAIAQLRSKLADGKAGGELGIYRILPDEWTADWSNKSFGVSLPQDPINNWRDQASHFALMARAAQTGVMKAKDVTYVDLYLAQLVGVPAFKLLKATASMSVEAALDTVGPTQLPAGNSSTKRILERYKPLLQKDGVPATGAEAAKQIETALDQALDDTRELFPQKGPAKDVKPIAGAGADVESGVAGVGAVTGRSDMARLIVESFAKAGYNQIQQIAALANAIEESGLDPTVKAAGDEQSFGLFQINLRGVGVGQNPEDLKNPQFNTDLIIREANKTGLKNAATLEEAVRIFVTEIERPADQRTAIAKRLATAQKLMVA